MFRFLTKQFLYGRLYLWTKEKIGGILFLFIAIFLVIYFHNEYLNYVEYKNKFDGGYIGLSFIVSAGFYTFIREKRKRILVTIDKPLR